MIGSIYQNNSLNFGSLTGSSRGIEASRYSGNSNATESSRPNDDMSFVNKLDKLNPIAPEQRDANHGKNLYLMG